MPVRSISLSCILARKFLPPREISLSSSSCASTPAAITSPLPNIDAASSARVDLMSSLSFPVSFMPEAILSRASTPVPLHRRLTGSICSRERPSWRTSRGSILPVDALEMMRSRSPTPRMQSCSSARISALSSSSCTTSYLSSRRDGSIRGIASHSRSNREPIGEQQRSIVSTRLTPSLPALLWKISRLRKVNLSIQTKRFSSIRDMEHMLPRPLC